MYNRKAIKITLQTSWYVLGINNVFKIVEFEE